MSRTANSPNTPRIWQDKNTSQHANLASQHSLPSGGEIMVYRWENGFAEGWLQLDEEGKQDRMPIDFPRKLVKQVTEKEGVVPSNDRFKGMVIISKLKLDDISDSFDWYELKVIVETTWTKAEYENVTSSNSIGPIGGKIKLDKNNLESKKNTETQNIFQGGGGVFASTIKNNFLKVHPFGSNKSWLELEIVPIDQVNLR